MFSARPALAWPRLELGYSLSDSCICSLFAYVRSAILTDERFLHFQLRRDMFLVASFYRRGCVWGSCGVGQGPAVALASVAAALAILYSYPCSRDVTSTFQVGAPTPIRRTPQLSR